MPCHISLTHFYNSSPIFVTKCWNQGNVLLAAALVFLHDGIVSCRHLSLRHTLSHTHIHTHTYTHTHTHTHTHSLTHSLSHSLSLSHSHISLSLSLSLTHTHTHTDTYLFLLGLYIRRGPGFESDSVVI